MITKVFGNGSGNSHLNITHLEQFLNVMKVILFLLSLGLGMKQFIKLKRMDLFIKRKVLVTLVSETVKP